MKYNVLESQAEKFFKAAAVDPKIQQLVKNIQYAISLELTAGSRTIDRLIRQYPKSAGLAPIKSIFSEISRINGQINPAEPRLGIDELQNKLKSASFFTSKSNAGTGYDPILTKDGPTSPAGFLARVQGHVNNLYKYLPKEQENKPISNV